MEPFVERMIQERDELESKMKKLRAFMFSDQNAALSSEDQALLSIQYDAMQTYFNVLSRRIKLHE